MPKLIERLIHQFERPSTFANDIRNLKRRRRHARWEPGLQADWTSSRPQSIIVDSVNPLVHRHRFRLHKLLSPSVTLQKNAQSDGKDGKHGFSREMTDAERDWWANPYLRMISSPVRKCIMTKRFLPREFLIRVNPRSIPAPRTTNPKHAQYALMPDGLEHSKFRNLHYRKAFYVLCRSDIVNQFRIRKHWKGFLPSKMTIHPSLRAQIAHLLRLRVIQELQILTDRLICLPQSANDAPILRRLTRAEFKELHETGRTPCSNAVAVIVVPPVNREFTTKTRPAPNMTALPDALSSSIASKRDPLPPSTMHLLGDTVDMKDVSASMSSAQVPVYNGVILFPSPPQRVALLNCLSRLLSIERRARYRQQQREYEQTFTSSADRATYSGRAKGDEKASHAFVLFSNKETLLRADSVPLATSLWRLRMWEGSSYSTSAGTWTRVDV